jgi:hypothetical protein
MKTKFGIDVKKVTKHHVYLSVERHKMIEVTRSGDAVSIGYQVDYSTEQFPIKTNSVAIIERCELGEHCRCVMGDQVDCWNWIGEVKL